MDLMRALNLAGMRSAFDDVMRAAIQHQRAPAEVLGDLLTAELAEKTAANRGHMARVLEEYFAEVEAADVFDYGAGYPVQDYLFGPAPKPVAWTITNPPFRLAEQFIERALDTSTEGVAMIVRAAFLEGVGRHERLFSRRPPSQILQFTERVVMHKGKLSEKGSTATAYCWFVWQKRLRIMQHAPPVPLVAAMPPEARAAGGL